MALTYASPTNLLEHLTLQETTLFLMRNAIITNDQTALVALYADLVTALGSDKTVAENVAGGNVNTLTA